MDPQPDTAIPVRVSKVRGEAIHRGEPLYRLVAAYKVTTQQPTEHPQAGLLGTAEADAEADRPWVYLRPAAGIAVPNVLRYTGGR